MAFVHMQNFGFDVHGGQRLLELFAAVTAPRTQDITREAFGVGTDQYIFLPANIACDQGQMFLIILTIAIIA